MGKIKKFFGKIGDCLLCVENSETAKNQPWGIKCTNCLKPTSDNVEEGETGPSRETWRNRCSFFISTLGMAVGLGQVWRFPTLAYSHGGAAFLIMYGIMILFFGNVLFFFEICNGQYTSKNPLRVYDKVPLFVGVGWSMIAYSYFFCTYYSQLVAYSMYYLYRSFTNELPWANCPSKERNPDLYACMSLAKFRSNDIDGLVCGTVGITYNRTTLCQGDVYYYSQTRDSCCGAAMVDMETCDLMFNITELCRPREFPSAYFWNHDVIETYRPKDPMHGYLGAMNTKLIVCSFLTWLIIYFTLYKGLKSMSFMMYIMVPLPYIVLTIMFGMAVSQKGALIGLEEFFVPKLYSFINLNSWRVAAEQAFYSTGVGMGPVITFGSYSTFNNPSHVDSTLICLCILLTSILCSSVVFSVLGFLSERTGKPFSEVVEAGPGLIFIAYPESIDLLPASPFFSCIFYIMLMSLGLSSVAGIIETVSSAVYDIWPKTRKYKYAVNFVILSSCFLLGLSINTRGGLVVYNVADTFAAGIPLIPIAVFELVIVIYIYGCGRFCEDIKFMIGFYPNRYYRYQWLIGPILLMAIFLYGLVVKKGEDHKVWAQILGPILCILVLIWIPIGMIFAILVFKKEKNLNNILKPDPTHGPKRPEDFEARQNYSVERKIL